MTLKRHFTTFLTSDSGAITVDWVTVTAGAVGLTLATIGVVSGGVDDASTELANDLATTEFSRSFGTDSDFAPTPLSWSQDQFDAAIEVYTTRDLAHTQFGAEEALRLTEGAATGDAHQLDAAAANIQALNNRGEPTAELQARYDAELARYTAANAL